MVARDGCGVEWWMRSSSVKSSHKGPRRDETGSRAIQTAARHAKWLEARRHGQSYRAIAAEHGVHHSTVEEAVAAALAAVRGEPSEALREFELGALDELIERTWDAVCDGELDKIEMLRKLRADRRKFLGLDAATKVEGIAQTVTLEELRSTLNAMGYDIVPLKETNGTEKAT